MKRIVYITIILILFTFPCTANTNLYIYKDSKCKEKVGILTKKQLQNLVTSTKEYTALLEAEKDNRVKIFAVEPLWEIYNESEFNSDIKLQWFNKQGKIIKEIKFNLKLNTSKSKFYFLRVWYRNIAEITLPVLIVVILLL